MIFEALWITTFAVLTRLCDGSVTAWLALDFVRRTGHETKSSRLIVLGSVLPLVFGYFYYSEVSKWIWLWSMVYVGLQHNIKHGWWDSDQCTPHSSLVGVGICQALSIAAWNTGGPWTMLCVFVMLIRHCQVWFLDMPSTKFEPLLTVMFLLSFPLSLCYEPNLALVLSIIARTVYIIQK